MPRRGAAEGLDALDRGRLDLLVAIYALSHSVALLADDRDFSMMKRAGAELLLVGP